MIRRTFAPLFVLVTLLSTIAPASAGVVTEPVVTGKPDQFGPGAEDATWVGWSQFVKPVVTAHIKTLTDPVDHRRLRRRSGSHSFFGGFDPTPGSEDVIFQDARRASSNLYLYDILTEDYDAPPAGINTERWEWAPDISAAFVVFGRNKFARGSSPWKVILYDRVAQEFETLDSVRNRCACIRPESVSEAYAAWVNCEGIRCQVWVHETATGRTMKVPNPNEKQQYSAAVTDDGQVYFVRSGNACGANVQIRRWAFGTEPASTLIYDYPSGTDLRLGLDVVRGADTNDDVYFDLFSCSDRRFRGDVYRILDANLLSAPVFGPEVSGAASGGGFKGLRLVGARPS